MIRRYISDHKFISIIVAICIIWMGSGVFISSSHPNINNSTISENIIPTVKVQQYTTANKNMVLSIRGVTKFNSEIDIMSSSSGKVIALPIKKGNTVNKGDVIIELELIGHKNKVKSLESSFQHAKIELESTKALFEKGLRSKSQLSEAQSLFEKYSSELTYANYELDNRKITAPFDGILEKLNVDIGDYITSGAMGRGTSIASIIGTSEPISVKIHISEKYIDKIKLNQQVKAKISDTEYQGIITFVGNYSDETTGTYRVEIQLLDTNQDIIRQGQNAYLKLILDSKQALFIPASALILNENGDLVIKTIDGQSIVQEYIVQILEDHKDGIWVYSDNIPHTLSIITRGGAIVTKGTKVKSS